MRFSEVIGQRELKRHLVRGVDAGRVSHAQLFTGRPGAGALPLALAYVQYLNCTNRRDGDSCGECPNCRQIAGLAHPDLHFVFPVNKQGKKSGEAVLSDDFMPLWRQVVSERNRLFLAARSGTTASTWAGLSKGRFRPAKPTVSSASSRSRALPPSTSA